jgi:hypothetical protein
VWSHQAPRLFQAHFCPKQPSPSGSASLQEGPAFFTSRAPRKEKTQRTSTQAEPERHPGSSSSKQASAKNCEYPIQEREYIHNYKIAFLSSKYLNTSVFKVLLMITIIKL